MNCINCRIRSKNYKKYMYCCAKRQEISYEDCGKCEFREYKIAKKMKNISSKRAKALDISPAVKKNVLLRDNGICVVCGKPGMPNSHFVKRSQGGLGIEENIATHCIECHYYFDNGPDDEKKKIIISRTKENFKKHYKHWREENLVYKK